MHKQRKNQVNKNYKETNVVYHDERMNEIP